ncbi:MAG: flagellar basal-body rod protein FlgG [Planctomycetota bacterium]|nr:flagellar basal-body rod protein FlgG [Planctomycetaceae bacterium]MDQ3332069.1 flagellar basal-body rod protein FlgG [Planctomycetota bacterium]
MSLRALNSAGTGMEAFQFNLDVLANNLANAGTTGFKRGRANFEDLMYERLKNPGVQDTLGNLTATGIDVGLGTKVASTTNDFGFGSLNQTESQYDLAITGDGYFQIQDGSEILYTRAGNFTVNPDGNIVLASANRGRFLEPQITVPPDAVSVSINSEGFVVAQIAGQAEQTQLGQIEIVRFINNQGLLHRGENLFSSTEASGAPLVGTPGQEGRGLIQQGFLEQSNVEPVRELVELIKTQRNFELNTQVVQAADQMLQQTANMRRF